MAKNPTVKVTAYLEASAELAESTTSLPHTVAIMVNEVLLQEPAWDVVGVTAETSVSGAGVAVVTNVDPDTHNTD